jgi:hypothetical protein
MKGMVLQDGLPVTAGKKTWEYAQCQKRHGVGVRMSRWLLQTCACVAAVIMMISMKKHSVCRMAAASTLGRAAGRQQA